MVVVEYTYEDMKKLINLPKDEMIALFSEMGAPSEYEPEVKKIITELTPNRPDWYSMEGLARSLKAYIKKGHPKYTTKKSAYKVIVDSSVARVRPYTVCAVVKGLEFNDQRIRDVILLQEKLMGTLGRKVKKFGLGLYPLNEITFPVQYTTMKPNEIKYIPLGYENEMSAEDILKNHKKGQQYGYLLEGHDRYPVFRDNEGRIMALIPIVNSAQTGKVNEQTKDLFIEVTGMDINACQAALNILVCTFVDMGGKIFEVSMDYGKQKFSTPNLKAKKIKLKINEVNKILGLKLGEKDILPLLMRMGYEYTKGTVLVPPYRADIVGVIDIIEDIAIAYGYNNFQPTIPDFFNPGQAIRDYDDIDEVLRGMGFIETKTFVLTNKEKLEGVGDIKTVVQIANPGSNDYTIIRPNLVVNILETFTTNKMKGLPQKFYEIGIVQNGNTSKKRLVFGVMDKKIDFSIFRGYLQTIMMEYGFEFNLDKIENSLFYRDTSCGVMVKGKSIGIMGKVNRELLKKKGIEFEVCICELET